MAKLILGTRSSKLALWQSNYVKELIENRFPEIIVEVREVRTQGDILSETPLIQIGGKGLFTKEIELELIAGSIDIAVHSLKDLPVELPQGLILAGVPERHNAEDVFIAKNGKIKFSDLSPGATVATGSLRRKSQLLAYRNDFNIVGLRGNVNTRINKLFQSEWDGIILARAGVERLGLESYMTEILPFEIMLPAVGQGALGLEAVHTNKFAFDIARQINHEPTEKAIRAERAFLLKMGGGCRFPMAAHSKIENRILEISGMAAEENGSNLIRKNLSGSADFPEQLGIKLAEMILNESSSKTM